MTNSVLLPGRPDAIPALALTGARRRELLRVTPAVALALRFVGLAVLIGLAYSAVFIDLGRAIGEGSRVAYLMVMPVLFIMIAYGRRPRPHGVTDSETDWILAGSLGGLALLLTYLAGNRFPTLAALWYLPVVSVVIWTACAATILFGARRVLQLWPLWLFAMVTVTPLPTSLIVSALGGTPVAASAVAALIGAFAVFLATPLCPLRRRLAATAGCAAAGVGAAFALAALPLPASVAVSAGVVPLLSFVACQRRSAAASGSTRTPTPPALPRRSPWGLAALAAFAGFNLVLYPAASASLPPRMLLATDLDWMSRAHLTQTQNFDFIRRYLGPDATFVRYLVPPKKGYPAAAVDIITTDKMEDLRTSRSVVWYPSGGIPNYRDLDISTQITGAQMLASDSSTTADSTTPNWYAVSWVWRAGGAFQQIFVIVNQPNQIAAEQDSPPQPVPPSVNDTVLAPFLWMTRQQADPSITVDPLVRERAQQIVDTIVNAAKPAR